MESKHQQLKFRDIHPNTKEDMRIIETNPHPIALLCDNFEFSRNIGMIFRLAEAARLSEVILWDGTHDVESKKLNRISRGNIPTVKHRTLSTVEDANELQQTYHIVAAEWTNHSTLVRDFKDQNKPILLLLGNEIRGLSDFWLERINTAIHVPMLGLKTSMNVACAASILTYQLLEKKGLF